MRAGHRTSPEKIAARRRFAGGAGPRADFARGAFARIFLIGFVLLFGAFALGYASAYLPPEVFWWTGLFAAMLPYLAALTLLSSFIFGAVFRGYAWLPALLILVLTGFRFLSWERFIPVWGSESDELVVMTYNAPVRGPNPDTLSEVTVRLIEQVRPDILALQEPAIWIHSGQAVRQATPHLQAIIDSLYYWAPLPDKSYRRRATLEQPVIARFPLEDVTQFGSTERAASARQNYITRVPFTWEGRPAVLYNVHLYTTGEVKPWESEVLRMNPVAWYEYLVQYRDAYLRRAAEARRLRQLLDKETLPMIVAGDFNSTVHHWEMRHIARGLTDAFTTKGWGWGGTYHMRLPFFRIDHILVSPEWQVASAAVPSMPTLSDHRPVVARLRWRAPP